MDPGALIGPAQGPLGAFRGVFAPTGPVYGPIGAPARGIPSEITEKLWPGRCGMPAEIARAGLPGSPRTSQRPPETAAKSERSDPGVFEGVRPLNQDLGSRKKAAKMPPFFVAPGGLEPSTHGL